MRERETYTQKERHKQTEKMDGRTDVETADGSTKKGTYGQSDGGKVNGRRFGRNGDEAEDGRERPSYGGKESRVVNSGSAALPLL